MRWAHILGLDNASGNWYLFWSGFGSDITELAIIGGLISLYRHHSCHQKGCWRIGRQQIEGTTWLVCHRHHPVGKRRADASQ